MFVESGDILRSLFLPCGQCVGCRLEHSREWAVRVMHESQMHDNSIFITLTYNSECLESMSLVYRDFQLFIKRLREHFHGQGIRYVVAGEYGDDMGRPHFHAILFGCWFDDREYFRTLDSGFKLYTSKTLDRLWQKGYASIGDVSFESAAYVARYCMKKMTGNNAEEHYKRLDWRYGDIVDVRPEFLRMSTVPPIGHGWFQKFGKEIYPRDEVVLRGKRMKPPRAYDKLLKKEVERFGMDSLIAVETSRFDKAMRVAHDNTADRLSVREVVAKARLSLHKRGVL